MQCAWYVSRDRTWWHRAAKHLPPSLPPSFASANVIITRHCKFMYIHVHMTISCTHSKFMYSLQIPIHITNSYRKCRNRQWPAVLHIHVHTTNSCTHYADIYTGRHRQTGTQRERERERVRERERERPAPVSISRLHNNGIFVYMYICIYVYMYICIHAYINIVVCVYTAVYRPCGPELAQGHRVSRPRGTGSVDDSVGEGSLLPCTQNPKD